jgi:D-3-phosphoglycerate dehydrogenase
VKNILLIAPPPLVEDFTALALAADRGGAKLYWQPATHPSESVQPERARALAEADAIITHEAGFTGYQMKFAERSVIVAHAGAGAGDVDLEAARLAGMQVVSVPEGATEEYIALTMEAMRESAVSIAAIREKLEARRLRLGLVGFGQVGRGVAAMAQELGCQVWATDPFVPEGIYDNLHVRSAELPDLLGICDVVTMQLPLHPATEGLLGTDELGLLKPGSCLINTSDARLVNLSALL